MACQCNLASIGVLFVNVNNARFAPTKHSMETAVCLSEMFPGIHDSVDSWLSSLGLMSLGFYNLGMRVNNQLSFLLTESFKGAFINSNSHILKCIPITSWCFSLCSLPRLPNSHRFVLQTNGDKLQTHSWIGHPYCFYLINAGRKGYCLKTKLGQFVIYESFVLNWKCVKCRQIVKYLFLDCRLY